MRKSGLFFIILFLLIGCGNSAKNEPARDGKGEIDVAEYLPKTDMVKHYKISGFRYYAKADEFITVNGHTIINEHHRGRSRFSDGWVTTTVTSYDDMNITIANDKNKIIECKYRYVDLGELISDEHTMSKSDMICLSSSDGCELGSIVGKVTKVYDSSCAYVSIENNITIANNKVIEGKFLKVVCNSESIYTTKVNEKFQSNQTLIAKEGKHGSGSEYTVYYQKDFGHILGFTQVYSVRCQGKKCEKQYENYGGSKILVGD